MKALPIIAFLGAPTPSDSALVAAIDQFEQNTINEEEELIKDFYTKPGLVFGLLKSQEVTVNPISTRFSENNDALRLFAFSKAIERVRNNLDPESENYQDIIKVFEVGQEAFENRVFWDGIYLTTAVVAGAIGCVFIGKGLVQFLCYGLTGIGAEGLFLWQANENIEEAYEMLFQDVDGQRPLTELKALTDAEFDMALAFALTPLGVGTFPFKDAYEGASVGLKVVLERIQNARARKLGK